VEIRRFGPGHRRRDGPVGTVGVAGQVIHHDSSALVSELAFQRFAMITPHTNPNTTLFIVISGGGFVQVGDERAGVNHGEAVVWPAGVLHGAYTDGTEMRAIVIELPRGGDTLVLEGAAAEIGRGTSEEAGEPEPETRRVEPAAPQTVTRGEGALAERQRLRDDYDAGEGEPW
jgi:quercetin dioxygenase-like cupin family protein